MPRRKVTLEPRCEAVLLCGPDRRRRCADPIVGVRNGRPVCWNHANAQTVTWFVTAEVLEQIAVNLEVVRRRQRVRDLRAELVRRERERRQYFLSAGRRPVACLLCADLPWRRDFPRCPGCGLPHCEELAR